MTVAAEKVRRAAVDPGHSPLARDVAKREFGVATELKCLAGGVGVVVVMLQAEGVEDGGIGDTQALLIDLFHVGIELKGHLVELSGSGAVSIGEGLLLGEPGVLLPDSMAIVLELLRALDATEQIRDVLLRLAHAVQRGALAEGPRVDAGRGCFQGVDAGEGVGVRVNVEAARGVG